MNRISGLYRVNLLDCVRAESRARREKMIQNTPVALLATVCRCRVNRSFESSTRPRQQKGHERKLSWAIRNNIPAFRLERGGSPEHPSRRPGSRLKIERETSLVKRMFGRSLEERCHVIPRTSEQNSHHSSMKIEASFCNTMVVTKLHGVTRRKTVNFSHSVSNALI